MLVLTTFTIFELRRTHVEGIFAVAYREGRPSKPILIPDGAIVEVPTTHQMRDAPERPEGFLGIRHGGSPATVHDWLLGLVGDFLPLAGVFLLSTGEVAAVYGSEAVPIG